MGVLGADVRAFGRAIFRGSDATRVTDAGTCRHERRSADSTKWAALQDRQTSRVPYMLRWS